MIVGFNPYFNWTMFLIEFKIYKNGKIELFQSLLLVDNVSYDYLGVPLNVGSSGFNPCYYWTMFLIYSKNNENGIYSIVSILVITGQCFLLDLIIILIFIYKVSILILTGQCFL